MSVNTSPAASARVPSSQEVVGFRVHTQEEITPAWVNATILPVWESARDGGRSLVALRRGWLGGQHVDVIGVGPGTSQTDWARLGSFVDAGPAPSMPVDAGEYLERARVRGQLENVAPPYLPLQDHGTILLLNADMVAWDRSGLGSLCEIGGAILAPSTVHSVRAVAETPEMLGNVILDVLTCIAATHALGAGYGTFSLRSHAEALLANWSPGGDLRREFTRRYQSQRAQAVNRVQEVMEGNGGAHVTAWRTGLAYLQGVLDDAVRRGELTNALVDNAAVPLASSETALTQRAQPDTDFHRSVYGSGVTELAGEWFAGYRFLINAAYSQLPLVGVSPLKRAYGCWAVAEAVDEVLGNSWADRLPSSTQ